MARRSFKITVDIPETAKVSDVLEFIQDSLSWAGSCRDPNDPMFHSLKNIEVKAVYVRKGSEYGS